MTSLRMTLVFCVVSAGWLLFKLPHFQDVMVYLGAMGRNFTKGPDIPILILIGMLSAPVIAYHALHLMRRSWPAAVERGRPVLYGAMLAAIALNSGKSDAFIYFQF
jgi:alginate O-acetyltransferase complex protein AlgI